MDSEDGKFRVMAYASGVWVATILFVAAKCVNSAMQGLYNRNYPPLLHLVELEGSFHNSVSEKAFTALLNISTLNSKNQPVTVLWDSGSDISLITHGAAKKLGLKGRNIILCAIK